jgi:hypothetical protein
MRPRLALPIALVGLLALAQAAAGSAGFGSTVTIHLTRDGGGTPRFHGRVISSEPACERRRKVVLFGAESGAPATKVATDRTNSHGKWRIRHSVNYRNHWAEVRRSEIAAGPCKADISRPLHSG